jgi:hypothetical protein
MSATDSAGDSENDARKPDLLISRNAAREAVRKALRLYVGTGRRYSYKELCNATGVPIRTIESATCAIDSVDYRPLPLECQLSIAKFLGAEFVSSYLAIAGLGAFELMDGQIPLPGILAADDAKDTAEIVSRAADGEFCEDDRNALKAVGQREIRRGMTLVSLGAAA